MTAVFDTSTIISGVFWRNESYRCLEALARRRYTLAISAEIFSEYVEKTYEVKDHEGFEEDPKPFLDWLALKARYFEPAPLPGPTCRDARDDKFLACALAAHAGYLVSRDDDLLHLGKPFGIAIVTPRQFLSRLG